MGKRIIVLLALVFGLQTGVACGVAGASVMTIEAPCCGGNCPFPSETSNMACCQARHWGSAALLVPSKPGTTSVQTPAILARQFAAMPLQGGMEQVPVAEAGPPGAVKLALLCSRQI